MSNQTKTAAQAIATAVNETKPTPSTVTSEAMLALLAQIEALKLENARIKSTKNSGKLSLKLSEKGGLSVYGLGRFPVSLYASQWEKLLAAVPAITAFLEENKAVMAVKSETHVTAVPAVVAAK